MVVVDQFLHLYESETTSSVWKVGQILLYVICGVSSIIASYSFGRLNFYYLNDNCLLYSNVTFVKEHISKSYTNIREIPEISISNVSRAQELHIGPVNNMLTEWGSPRACSYCIYVPTCSFIFCFVWATFFIMCGRGGRSKRGLPSPWRIVCPSLCFNTLYFVTSSVASAWLHSGLEVFCNNFKKNMDETSCDALYRYASPPSHAVYTFVRLAEVFSWVNTFIWLLHVVCLILRCVWVADFDLYRIQIITAQTVSSNRVKVKFEDLDGEAPSLPPTPKRTPIASKKKTRPTIKVNVIENPGNNFALKEKVSSLFRLGKVEDALKKKKPVKFETNKNPLILVEDLSESSADTSEVYSVEDNAPTILTDLNEDEEDVTTLPHDTPKKRTALPASATRKKVRLQGYKDSIDSTDEGKDAANPGDLNNKEVEDEIKTNDDMVQLYSAAKRLDSPPTLDSNLVTSNVVKIGDQEEYMSSMSPTDSSDGNKEMVEIFNANYNFEKSIISSVSGLESLPSDGDDSAGPNGGNKTSPPLDVKSTTAEHDNEVGTVEATGASGLLESYNPERSESLPLITEMSIGTSMTDFPLK